MDSITLESLEYPLLLKELEGLAQTPFGKDKALLLSPDMDLPAIDKAFSELYEACYRLKVLGPCPLAGLSDIRPALARIGPEGAYLVPEEFIELRGMLSTVSTLQTLAAPDFTQRYPLTTARIKSLTGNKELLSAIIRTFDESGLITDSASTALGRIRRHMRSLKEGIRSLLEGFLSSSNFKDALQNELFSIRDDRYVLIVRASAHTKVKGIIHGRSASGATFFIEPFEAVEPNNRLSILRREEKEEEIEVLRLLTKDVAGHRREILDDIEIIAWLDLLEAKAGFGERLSAYIPLIEENGSTDIKAARHPLLILKELKGGCSVVPIDIRIPSDKKVLVISGANAGGKTVSLKTLGLLTLMVKSGLAIPAEQGSRVVVHSDVFADIGDRQSITDDLSTFSAHIRRTNEILKAAGPGSLVLIDEIGAGTDPSEGSVLALSLLDWLKTRVGLTVVTTHLNLIKAHAARDQLFENASVSFDEETMRPLYNLSYGFPGVSLGLGVAEKFGIPLDIIARAREGLKGLSDGEYVEALELLRKEIEGQRTINERLLRLAEKRENVVEGFRAERERFIERYRERYKKRLDDIVDNASSRIKEIIEGAEAKNTRRQIERHLDRVVKAQNLAYDELDVGTEPLRFSKGDMVEVAGTGKRGTVVNVDGKGPLTDVMIGNLKIRLPLNKLKKIEPSIKEKRRSVVSFPAPTLDPVLNLIGMRVEEALKEVARTIDNAHMAGQETIEIIHGIGALAKAIRELLKTNPLVRGVKRRDPLKGDAITIAEII
ncbi:MAG: Smr/MutS family protein [Deltaproteobacteria bacterium]|nr:Smr/MutS family protein [Deltaproteobacteria bacterium]